MKNTKLTRLLKTFSDEEWKEFGKFAASPYFNKGRYYFAFLKELKKFRPALDSPKFTKENLYAKIYPDKPYKETVINTMSSGLYSLAEEFLVQEKIKSKNNFKDALLIRELTNKNMKQEAESLIRVSEQKYISKQISADNYSNHETYGSMLYHYVNYDVHNKIIEYAGKNYVSTLHLFINNALTNQRIINVNKAFFQFPFENNPITRTNRSININELVNFINAENEQLSLPITMNYYYHLSNNNPEQIIYYHKLKELFLKYFNRMDRDLKKSSCIQLVSICLNKIAIGKPEFHLEFSIIYKLLIKNELYDNTENKGYFSNRLFRAIIITSNYLNEIMWSEEFVSDYIDKVHPQFREQLRQNCLARIEFCKRNFKKSLEHVTKIEQNSILSKLDVKNLIAKIYYETNSIEPLNSHLDTYKHLVKNLNLQEKMQKSAHANFIKFLQKLVKYDNNNIESLDLLKNSINKTKIINNKLWLLEKIEELEK